MEKEDRIQRSSGIVTTVRRPESRFLDGGGPGGVGRDDRREDGYDRKYMFTSKTPKAREGEREKLTPKHSHTQKTLFFFCPV